MKSTEQYQDERFVSNYLETLGFKDIILEPFSNETPDLLLNNQIGVEVRRLNQNYVKSSLNYEDLQNKSKSIEFKMLKLLDELSDRSEESWYVQIGFQRPIKIDQKLINEIKSELIQFRESEIRSGVVIQTSRKLTIKLTRSGHKNGDFFRFGGIIDFDSGGWVFEKLLMNLEISVREKEIKVKLHSDRCHKWWLILLDYNTGSNYDENEVIELTNLVQNYPIFDKIMIIDRELGHLKFEYQKV
jgi:hypothetical protein